MGGTNRVAALAALGLAFAGAPAVAQTGRSALDEVQVLRLPNGEDLYQPEAWNKEWVSWQKSIDGVVAAAAACDREAYDSARRMIDNQVAHEAEEAAPYRERLRAAFIRMRDSLPSFPDSCVPPPSDPASEALSLAGDPPPPLGGRFHVGVFAGYADATAQYIETGGNTDKFDVSAKEFGIDVGYSRRLTATLGLGVSLKFVNSNLEGGTRVNCPPGCDAATPWRAEAVGTLRYDLGPVTTYVVGGITLVHVEADVGGFPGNADNAVGPLFGLGIEIPVAPNFVFDLSAMHFGAEANGICDPAACGGAADIKTRATVFGAEFKVIM
ncbi:MAG: hypothetical protein WDN24_09965 [Sphingomonas sp.]